MFASNYINLMNFFWHFFLWFDSPSGSKPHHFRGLITFRNGLRKATYILVGSEFTHSFKTH